MTGETLSVVIRSVFLKLLVRIVTSEAADARIVGIVAATVKYPVRLKTYVVDPRLAGQKHGLLETGVACPTKGLRKLDGRQMPGQIDVPFRNAELGVINIQEMANSLKNALSYQGNFTSAQFAASMIEGSPKIRFGYKSN